MHNLDVFLNDTGIESVRLNTPDINNFVFDCINQGSEEMYKDIIDFIKMLLKYGNTCKIYLDEEEIVVVEYGHDNRTDDWGSPNLEWITDEETEILNDFRTGTVADIMSQASKESVTEEDECCDPYPCECNFSK